MTPDLGIAVLFLVGGAWLLVAVWAVVRAARIGAQVKVAQAWGLRLRGLLATAPGAYLIVGDAGRITMSDTLRRWLNLGSRASRLSELGPSETAGLDGADFTDFENAVSSAAVSGVPFTMSVRTVDGSLLRAEGVSAPPEVAGDRGVVVWFSDLSDTAERLRAMEEERRTELERSQAARAIIDQAPVPLWRRDANLKLVEVNGAYARAVDAATPAAAVEAGAELLAGPLSTGAHAAARQVLESGEMMVREETAIIDGERRRLRIAEVPLKSGGVAGYALDISDVEDARAERDRLLNAQSNIFARLSAGVARFGSDRHMIAANQAFLRLFKFDESMLLEAPEFDRVLERMREARRLPEQRDFPGWKAERREWFHSAEGSLEETWVLPDNEVLRVIAQPAPDGGLVIIFEDQSERLRLASSRDQLVRVQDTTLQNLHEAVAVFGSSGRLQFYNQAFRIMWGVPPHVLESSPHVDELFGSAQAQMAGGGVKELMRGLIRVSTEGRAERNGRIELTGDRYVRFSAVPLPDGNALFTFDDITDTERVELALRDRNEALETADRAKSRFVENMSYELRTPLTAISGFGEMLSTGLAGELTKQQADYVGSILTSAERLRVMINGIIDLALSDAKGIVLNAEEADIGDLLDGAIAMVRGMAEDRRLVVSGAAAENMEPLSADGVRLQQAVYNLLSNAVRFTPEGGRINVVAASEGNDVVITVSDNGIGIPAEDQPHIFERFFKASNAARTPGVGLGLSFVQEVVQLHGGDIEVRSAVGKGTRMTLRLPRKSRPPLAEPSRPIGLAR